MQYEISQKHLQDLNPPQLEAVTYFEGPILVLAGAGSGKTRVLTRRVVHLVTHHKVKPCHILAVTFTNKATEEMRQRLAASLGGAARDLWVATFHSTAVRMLRHHAHLLGYQNDFSIYDEQDSRSAIKRILKERHISEKEYPLDLFLRGIDRAKNAYISPAKLAQEAATPEAELVAEVYDLYQRALLAANAMDFVDLLVNCTRLLLEFPPVLAFYRDLFHFILVDEFQDTNKIQYLLIKLLGKPRNNVLVVGDDDQSIYSFRGASVENIFQFEKDFPNTKIVTLEQNYRSTESILEAAHAIISKNVERKPKKLWTSSKERSPIFTYVGYDEGDEARFVAAQIAELLKAGRGAEEIAVFYRTNAQSRALEEALMDLGIPYRIYGGLKFYERKEIKDIIGYLRLVVNSSDAEAFLRVINTPARGIGAQTVKVIADHCRSANVSLWEACSEVGKRNAKVQNFVTLLTTLRKLAETATLAELIRAVVDKTGYAKKLEESKDITAESRLDNIKELQAIGLTLQGAGATPWESLKLFLERTSLCSSGDLPSGESKNSAPLVEALAAAPEKQPPSLSQSRGKGQAQEETLPPAISLMTLHLAKGLEFPLVFFTGIEEGLVPHYRSIGDPVAVEEERRLCYVGVTRAMQTLYLSRATKRGMFAVSDEMGISSRFRRPSRFLLDIPQTFLQAKGGGDICCSSSLWGDEDTFFDANDSLNTAENGGPSSLGRGKTPGKGAKEEFTIDDWVSTADDLE